MTIKHKNPILLKVKSFLKISTTYALYIMHNMINGFFVNYILF